MLPRKDSRERGHSKYLPHLLVLLTLLEKEHKSLLPFQSYLNTRILWHICNRNILRHLPGHIIPVLQTRDPRDFLPCSLQHGFHIGKEPAIHSGPYCKLRRSLLHMEFCCLLMLPLLILLLEKNRTPLNSRLLHIHLNLQGIVLKIYLLSCLTETLTGKYNFFCIPVFQTGKLRQKHFIIVFLCDKLLKK